MIVNSGLAHLSDGLFAAAIAVYVVALIGYCGEYAFGWRGMGAPAAARPVEVAARAEPSLVAAGSGAGGGAGAGPATETAPAGPPDVPPGAPEPPQVTYPWLARLVSSGRLGGLAGRFALAATTVGAALHAGSVITRGVATHRVPWGNMYEFSSAAGLVAIVGFLAVVARARQARLLGLFVMLPVVLIMFLAGTVLYTRAGPLVPALHSYWLAIHVTAAIIATGVFMVSFVITVLFLVRDRYDRLLAAGTPARRLPVAMGWRLPPARTLDRLAYRATAFGFPIWTFGIIAGAIWAEAAWGRYWGWDPKETWAFIAWVVYAGYLHARATAGWKGSRAAWINVLGFAAMVFNFFVVNIIISGLHSYAGLN